MSDVPVLRARALSYHPPGVAHVVLDDVALDLVRGEVVDVVGPSGSGKTTLLRALARLLPEAAGALALDGADVGTIDAQEWRTRVVLLPQVTTLLDGTVRENLTLPWTLKVRANQHIPTDDELREALDSVGLDEIALDRDGARLSVGQAARIALLRVMLTRPKVLLLDEPDANLDNESACVVSELVARFADEGGAVVRVRHMQRGAGGSRTLRLADGVLEEVSS